MKTMDYGNIAKMVRSIRQARGFAQVELSKRSGVAQTTISAIERGAHGSVTVATVYSLAAALGVCPIALQVPGAGADLVMSGQIKQLLDHFVRATPEGRRWILEFAQREGDPHTG